MFVPPLFHARMIGEQKCAQSVRAQEQVAVVRVTLSIEGFVCSVAHMLFRELWWLYNRRASSLQAALECLAFQRGARGADLGLLFAGPGAGAERFVVPENGGGEILGVVEAAFGDDFIAQVNGSKGLADFLEAAFGIALVLETPGGIQRLREVPAHKALRRSESAIEIDGSEDGLDNISEDVFIFAAAHRFLAAADQHVAAEAQLP